MFLTRFWYWITGKKKKQAIVPIKNPTNANLQDDLKNIKNKYPNNNEYIPQNEYHDTQHHDSSSGLLTGMLLGEILNETMRSRHRDSLDNDFDINDGFDDAFGGGSSGGGGADDSWDSDSFSDDSDFDD